VTISSPIEEREEEDGWEDISTQDSASFRIRGGTPDERAMASVCLAIVLLVICSLYLRDGRLAGGGGMLMMRVRVGSPAVRLSQEIEC
jgi:hypothetical protein